MYRNIIHIFFGQLFQWSWKISSTIPEVTSSSLHSILFWSIAIKTSCIQPWPTMVTTTNSPHLFINTAPPLKWVNHFLPLFTLSWPCDLTCSNQQNVAKVTLVDTEVGLKRTSKLPLSHRAHRPPCFGITITICAGHIKEN
jgi:hypothetical protein